VFINDQIRANSIMIIGEDGANIGTFPRDKALMMAQEA
jgi:translation initiation factor IF-3